MERHLVYVVFSFEFFFNNLNAETVAIMSPFSKFLKSEHNSVSFSTGIILPAKHVMVSGTRQLVSRNRRRKMVHVSST